VHFAIAKGNVAAMATRDSAIVNYRAHDGEAEADRFVGTLPGIGGVSVRFHQRGKTKRIAILCPKAPTLVRPGFFVGTIRLRGEKGYTEVRASRAPGTVSETPGRNCGHQRNQRQPALMRAMKAAKPHFLSIQAKAGNVSFYSGQIIGSEKLELSILQSLRLQALRRVAPAQFGVPLRQGTRLAAATWPR
jgi:hypothetical protein